MSLPTEDIKAVVNIQVFLWFSGWHIHLRRSLRRCQWETRDRFLKELLGRFTRGGMEAMGIEVFKWLQLCNRDALHARKRTGGERGKRHTERSSSSHFAAVEEHTAFILQLKEVSPAETAAPSLAVMRYAGAPYISLLKVTSRQHLLLCPPALTHKW